MKRATAKADAAIQESSGPYAPTTAAARLLSRSASSRRTASSSAASTSTASSASTTGNFTPHPEYDDLPDVIKVAVSPKEFAWLTDSQRTSLIADLCTPDVEG
jgi:hypothetical protein